MTTTPAGPPSGDQDDAAPGAPSASSARGAEIGISEGEGSTFEPEEDPEGHD